jgi:hypothetical protein
LPATSIEVEHNSVEPKSVTARARLIFAGTIFLSALLLFQVQLIISKCILPWFGGAASVWTTSMLVFQLLLLGGYSYSHLVSERLSQKAQSNVHLGMLAAASILVLTLSLRWPSAITPGASWKPQYVSNPVSSVIAIILLAAGLPFFVLSTTGPLLQRWFAHQGGSTTYRLYAISNLGSLLGLLTYPFLLEPLLRMSSQGRLWAFLFGIFAAGCAWCAWRARCNSDETAVTDDTSVPAVIKATASDRLLWFLLAACASSLLLSTTNLLCQEVAAIPLLWVLPLTLYLLSFVLCFDHPRWYRREVFHPLFAMGLLVFWAVAQFKLASAEIVVMPVLFFVACMVCHGELSRLRPAVRLLTSFYLSVSAGGAAGGIFVAVIAPQVFHSFVEFQLSLAACIVLLLCCLLRDRASWIFRMGFGISASVVTGVLLLAYAGGTWIPDLARFLDRYKFYPLALLVSVPVLLGEYLKQSKLPARNRTYRAGQVLVLVLGALCTAALCQTLQSDASLVLAKRNFYGALRVFEFSQGGKALYHGQTVHGAQLNPPNDRLPVAYYGPESGIGILLRNHPERSLGNGSLRLGVVGLGAGTLAAYGLPGDYIRYYEINPDVARISAGAQPVFTYIRDSQAKVDTELGDARLLLEREVARGEAQNFDVLVLDAFSGDAIPVHLLTSEAFDIYWKHVNLERGIIAIHVSSRHINLMPVLEGIAAHYNARILVRVQDADYPFLTNWWVFLARHQKDLAVKGLYPTPIAKSVPRVWTDDYSDIIRLLY